MENSFKQYVAETRKEFKYVLKFALNDMPDLMIDQLEESLKKYELKSASSFRKTPIQESPLDFPNVRNTSVYICDISLGYPGSLDFLRTYICNILGISPQCLAVYSENDPRQIETDLYVDRTSPEFKKKYKTLLGSDYEEVENSQEEKYGEKYNINFLKELENVRKERETVKVENALSQGEKFDHSMMPADYDGFNNDKNLKKNEVGFFGRIKRVNLLKPSMF
jgi:hypothetical protein